MIYRSDRMFALGHLFVPLLLFSLHWQQQQLILLVLTFSSLLWALYLIYHSFLLKNLHEVLRSSQTFWIYLSTDLLFNLMIHLLPTWDVLSQPTYMILFIAPLYAFELGMRQTVYLSLFGMANIYLALLFNGGNFYSYNTLLVAMGLFVFILFVGRNTNRLNQLSYYDSLTQLPNRQMLKELLSEALRASRKQESPLGVLFLDLDQFKYVNDTMGHAAGDILLQTAAKRMMKLMPKGAILARMGGDEFAFILPRMGSSDDAKRFAEMIIETFKESFPLNNNEVFITTSIGISVFPDDGRNADTLMKNADTAMYRAKEQGRNNYQYYTPTAHPDGIERIKMETMMRHAIERDEFVVYYQPRMSTYTGELVCVEALVRWMNPDKGMISPKDFIPLAEDTGLIVPIGEMVLRKACLQRKLWTEQGYPSFRISVNLSTRQFRELDLPETIGKVLKATNMDPELLELEVTESAAMKDVNFAILMLRVLKDMGMRIAIDDFGTGYSSLSYLKKFPIDVIKIDQSFISGIHKDSDDSAIVRAIIVLAHTLKLHVTAEGVETSEQYHFLEEQDCDEVQGYLFGKPMNAKTLEDWMNLREKDAVGS
mgnify:FL=1